MNNQNDEITQKVNFKAGSFFNFNTALFVTLLLAFALIIIMAVTSDYDSHPDEKVHFEAVKYYISNWLPPEIGDPATLESYSAYGKSRLYLPDYYYFFAGKFTALLSLVTRDDLLSARLFNVSLFLILIILCMRVTDKRRLIFGVFLLTPQVWYLFSYVNSDAFALFLTIIITVQLLLGNSPLMMYLNSASYTSTFYNSIPMILLVLFLYSAKENYYIYLIFLLLWGIWFMFSRTDRKKIFVKYLIMVIVFISLVLARQGFDYALYGPDKDNKLKEMQEITALDEYKPSVRSTGEGHPNLNLKRKGVMYLELFDAPYNWHHGTFYTFTGAYGYLEYFGTAKYYLIVFMFYIFLAAALLLLLWKRGGEARFFILSTFMLALLTIYLASYHSWISDFQPQGRYLFPLFGVAAYLFGRYSKELSRQLIFTLPLLCLAVLSLYSFIVYGLIQI